MKSRLLPPSVAIGNCTVMASSVQNVIPVGPPGVGVGPGVGLAVGAGDTVGVGPGVFVGVGGPGVAVGATGAMYDTSLERPPSVPIVSYATATKKLT